MEKFVSLRTSFQKTFSGGKLAFIEKKLSLYFSRFNAIHLQFWTFFKLAASLVK